MFLSTRQRHAALTDAGVVALGQAGNELGRASRLGGPGDVVLGCVSLAKADVLADGAREQRGLLHHDADLPAQRPQGDVADVKAFDHDLAAADVIEARDEVGDRRLA